MVMVGDYVKEEEILEEKRMLMMKQDQTGLDRSARSTLDFGANTVEGYT